MHSLIFTPAAPLGKVIGTAALGVEMNRALQQYQIVLLRLPQGTAKQGRRSKQSILVDLGAVFPLVWRNGIASPFSAVAFWSHG